MSDYLNASRAPAKRCVWESGHYYRVKGLTAWSRAGWDIAQRLINVPDECGLSRDEKDAQMLFIDDVHTLEQMRKEEREAAPIDLTFNPAPTHIVLESDMCAYAEEALVALAEMSSKRQLRISNGRLRYSGFLLKGEDGRPTCLLYDLGLTWHKRGLGFTQAVNVLPEFYESEQRALLQLVRKVMPDFELKVVLHDLRGLYRYLT